MTDAGDKIFNQVFLQYHPQLYHFGCKIHSDKYLIEEAIQNLFLYLYEKKTDFTKITNTKAYLFTAFRRELLTSISKARLQGKLVLSTDIFYATTDFMELHHSNSRDPKQLVEILNSLPWRQKEAVYLKYFNNLSTKEIATIMKIQPQVVSNTIYKALLKLKKAGPSILLSAYTAHTLSLPSILSSI